ncbi:uncharacterized protein LOC132258328 [Phlebotomus argentipes]|uniref:uncharacterized protein LOC132258328 n=1 Tax=Phlebotomus argentipes TaxID=94469 RepID=UPI0028936300|nr:uncharacterized protein LOC132258328 [Phlebotomus argentipes]
MSWQKEIILIAWLCCGLSVATSDMSSSESNGGGSERPCLEDSGCPLGEFCYFLPGNVEDVGRCASCGPLMTYNYETKHCTYCPVFKEKCYNNCCYPIDGYANYQIRCVDGMCQRCHKTDTESRQCTLQSYQDITSKFIVAFAIAFSVGLTAIIIYRWSFRGRREHMPERRFSLHDETIFSSPVQERTLELMRDRPPGYQTRHNYRFEQEAKANSADQQVPTVASSAPPPYPGMESGAESAADNVQPPPYSQTEQSSEKTLHI